MKKSKQKRQISPKRGLSLVEKRKRCYGLLSKGQQKKGGQKARSPDKDRKKAAKEVESHEKNFHCAPLKSSRIEKKVRMR